ncbi:ThiF family adenylyltransferase [Nitrogeniibacter aestuarii]|uniref:ThiF family adenylyltransferase n=1 Tax=Nitrogeniibacter aestuarii TaxID=2815343 RepID=UPI001D1096A1|nr:ThiF family adenylyltransferase [Nitrogeniibacter aestuarii]
MIRPHKPVRVAISGKHHVALKQHLFPGDGNEAVAFALCGRARRENLELLTVREIVPIPYDACSIRTPHRVTWSGAALEPTLARATAENLALVKLHSHPTGYPWFSDTDDVAEGELFPSLFGWLDSEAPLASIIMLPDGSLVGRAVHPSGGGDRLDCIRVAGDDFSFWHDTPEPDNLPEHGIRIAQAFGTQTYALLRKLRIGVVGCSGTGSIVIEQLARNCVGELVLVDPDHVEHKNLNRILNSTVRDAESGEAKTRVLKRAIQRIGLGTKVIAFEDDLMGREILKALSTCDILVGCMDSIDGRHVLNKLASAYVIPLIDVGVRLEADGMGGIDSIWATAHTVLPGGSSLLSRRVYNSADLDSAFLKRYNPEAYEEKRNLGYIKGIREDQPAVISVNMTASATAVNELLARLHPYRLKPNRAFAIRRISLTDSEADSNEPEGEPCTVMQRWVGVGDQEPFLGMPELGDAE